MRRTAFTLVELLVVISVIAVLAGLLIPMIGYARTSAKVAKGEAQLGTLKASLALFKDANGHYPEKDGTGPDEVFAKTFTNAGATGAGKYKTAEQVGSTGWNRIAESLLMQLQTVDRDNYRTIDSLRDPFSGGGTKGHVVRYRPAKFYPLLEAAPAVRTIDSEDPPNPDSYQLWSAGPDGKDQYGDRVDGKKSDDLANWKTP
jgi:prepilin-type N-terminal cleavage/methylation domain-containing protein